MAGGTDPQLTGCKGDGGRFHLRHLVELALNFGSTVGAVQTLNVIHPGFQVSAHRMVAVVFLVVMVMMLMAAGAFVLVIIVVMMVVMLVAAIALVLTMVVMVVLVVMVMTAAAFFLMVVVMLVFMFVRHIKILLLRQSKQCDVRSAALHISFDNCCFLKYNVSVTEHFVL